MKVQFNNTDKAIVQVILYDIITATVRANDRQVRRHAQRILNKFDINTKEEFNKLNSKNNIMPISQLVGMVEESKNVPIVRDALRQSLLSGEIDEKTYNVYSDIIQNRNVVNNVHYSERKQENKLRPGTTRKMYK